MEEQAEEGPRLSGCNSQLSLYRKETGLNEYLKTTEALQCVSVS